MKIEQRSFAGTLRAASDEGKFELRGYAAAFNSLSKDLGGFKERLAPGCFKRSLDEGDDVFALFNHDRNIILGRRSAKTLDVAEDDKGLKFAVRLNPASQSHRDIYASVQRGDISECSFAFTVNDDADQDLEDATDEKGQRFIRRTIKRCSLLDVSVVTYPAYNTTSVQARSADYAFTPADAAWHRDACRRAEAIYREMVRTATGFKEIAPGTFVPCEWDEEAMLDRALRAKADAVGEQIKKDWLM